ncbi:hypothetical protein UPYG_G00130250 [Umbra pygmaea]|uniref:TLC domain-containing protein n=1 Tax=Umbra pygmaea TaxID=75934 RepID=A0ABD0X6V7_UMBPY
MSGLRHFQPPYGCQNTVHSRTQPLEHCLVALNSGDHIHGHCGPHVGLLHTVLRRLPRPEGVQTHPWKNWKWNNLSVSLCHSSITAVWALSCVAQSPIMLKEMHLPSSPVTYLLACFSTGYFLHDASDILLSSYARASWEFLLHHVLVLWCFLYAILTHRYVAGVSVALFVEVNSIFLHSRLMMRLACIDKSSYPYTFVKLLNLITYVLFRLGAQFLITRFIIMNYAWLDHATSLLVAIGAMNIMMMVYLWRLVHADFLPQRQLCHNDNRSKGTHDEESSSLKQD